MPQVTRHRICWRYRASKRWKYMDGTAELAEGVTIRSWLKHHGLAPVAEVLYVGPARNRWSNGGRWLFTDPIKASDVPKQEEEA